ncbi:MAG: DUF6345 domain-containing protein [Verrucomicrobia bacterium]|nr:DUF6345 domain-containing protein [Verrucomicrobiota bacterium]
MKRTPIMLVALSGVLSLGLLSQKACGQSVLHFTGVSATEEGAITLSWASCSNEVYRIEYAPTLIDTNTGTTAWASLYDDYPSHGTNTFWLDTGDYYDEPAILHPRNMPMRFYRIVMEGTNTLSPPTVSILSPTNGASVSGDLTVTVSASTTQPVLHVKLYVDGEEMPLSDDGTNFVIDTCEWPNGNHVLFATAKCESDFAGQSINPPYIEAGRAISSYVNVTFDNLITRFSFSEPFFDPGVGQTQQVNAVFAANSDWSLEIQDQSSNTVRTVTGSGTAMQFGWDGNGDGGTNIPNGVYTYLLSAQTNGQTSSMMGESIGFPTAAEKVVELWALSPDSSGPPAPLMLYPPGFDTNGLLIFEATQSEIQELIDLVMSSDASGAMSPEMETGEESSGAEQAFGPNTPAMQMARAPRRRPTAPVKGVVGTFGVAYQRYLPSHISLVNPLNGLPLQQRVAIAGHGGSTPITYTNLPQFKSQANEFITQMKNGAWRPGFVKTDTQLKPSDIKSSETIFNQVSLGLLMVHGTYGTSPDYTANGCLQMYFPIQTMGTSGEYVRMSEMEFGNAGTNGLKWMALFCCNSLKESNWNNMQSAGITPFNSNLHLLLGTDSIIATEDWISGLWARAMLGLSYPSPQRIRQAWYDSAQTAYAVRSFGQTFKFAVAGWQNCWNDKLNDYSSPGGDIIYESVQVYP